MNKGYYITDLYDDNHVWRTKTIHRLVLNAFENTVEDKACVDHIDNNPLNNCLFNLRFATRGENQHNQVVNKANTSGVKGVFWDNQKSKWHAVIKLNRKQIHIGFFDNIEDANIARQNKAKDFTNECELFFWSLGLSLQ